MPYNLPTPTHLLLPGLVGIPVVRMFAEASQRFQVGVVQRLVLQLVREFLVGVERVPLGVGQKALPFGVVEELVVLDKPVACDGNTSPKIAK